MTSHQVRHHYERHPYPDYPLLASVRREDTYALNLQGIWARFNGTLLQQNTGKILCAGCGAFAPYPLSMANPKAQVTALDLSSANLHRARLHCLLHNRRRITFVQGDLLDVTVSPGPFHYIDCFGVLHHLENPADGLRALADRLLPDGILRVMVYGRYARKEAESIRRAARILGISDITALKSLVRRARPGSRFRNYLESSWEARSDAGLADLFLHPCVHTYRIDDFLMLLSACQLKPLLFAHDSALADPDQEVERLRQLDRDRKTPTNIICYLGHAARKPYETGNNTVLLLNPCLDAAVSPCRLRTVQIPSRLGKQNPPLDRSARSFLRQFRTPVSTENLNQTDLQLAHRFQAAHFLLAYQPATEE